MAANVRFNLGSPGPPTKAQTTTLTFKVVSGADQNAYANSSCCRHLDLQDTPARVAARSLKISRMRPVRPAVLTFPSPFQGWRCSQAWTGPSDQNKVQLQPLQRMFLKLFDFTGAEQHAALIWVRRGNDIRPFRTIQMRKDAQCQRLSARRASGNAAGPRGFPPGVCLTLMVR